MANFFNRPRPTDNPYGPYGAPPAGSQWEGSTYHYQPGGPPPPWVSPENWTTPQSPTSAPGTPTPSPFNYEQARDSWMSGQYGTGEAGARAWAQANGVQYDGGDSITLPNGGGAIDIIGNFAGGSGNGSPMTNNWTPAGGNGSNPNGSGYSTYGAGGGGYGGFSGAGFGNPQVEELYNLLLGRATQGTNVDRNDPAIHDQSEAYAANEQRASRDYLGDIAERSGPNANLRGEERMAAEGVGQRTGAFEAELMGRELTARRDEIAGALESMQGLLTSQQQMALQHELAQMNAAIQQQQINNQNAQYYATLGFNTEDRSSYWNAIRSGLL